MEVKTFTIDEIERLYNRYQSITGIRVQKEGKWTYTFTKKRLSNIDGTRAETVKLSQIMSFVDYLRKLHGN